MKKVYLVHGYLASDLNITATGQKIWWSTDFSMLVGVGALRLAANGTDPGPPDGLPLSVAGAGQDPWPICATFLRVQLNNAVWEVKLFQWDFRKDIDAAATALAAQVRAEATVTEPATLVGHSAGGLVCVLAYAKLKATAQDNLVRRLITIATPFQGSYLPIMWANGLGEAISQLTALGTNPIAALAGNGLAFTLYFLANLAFTWPAHYQLFPAAQGSEADSDPLRPLLYEASNYGPNYAVSQARIDQSLLTFQRAVRDPATFPPSWVATYVFGNGITTPYKLTTGSIPVNLRALGYNNDGDGVATTGSASRTPGQLIGYPGAHSSLPFGITGTGDLAKMITDPRGPPDPPPPPINSTIPIGITITAPPISDPESALTCIGGG